MDAFVANLTPDQVHQLFMQYYDGSYAHLMRGAIARLSIEKERDSLAEYLGRFTDQNACDEERRDVLTSIVSSRDFQALLNVVQNDQHFQEPLYRIANR